MDQRIARLEALVMGNSTKIDTLRDVSESHETLLNGDHTLGAPPLRRQLREVSGKLDAFMDRYMAALTRVTIISISALAVSIMAAVFTAVLIVVELSK